MTRTDEVTIELTIYRRLNEDLRQSAFGTPSLVSERIEQLSTELDELILYGDPTAQAWPADLTKALSSEMLAIARG